MCLRKAHAFVGLFNLEHYSSLTEYVLLLNLNDMYKCFLADTNKAVHI